VTAAVPTYLRLAEWFEVPVERLLGVGERAAS
jgi:hypothetical protein